MRARPAAALALAALLGCGEAEAPTTAAGTATAAKPAPAGSVAGAPGVRIRREPDGRLRVRAHRVDRLRVLEELAQVAGFALVRGAGAPAPRAVDLELADASAEDVLAAVAADVPHHLEYAPGRGGAELVRVTLGGVAPPIPPTARAAEPSGRGRAERDPDDPHGPDAASADPPLRDDGERLEGTPAELVVALRAPDPTKRAAAARALGEIEGGEDAFRAAHALLGALADDDPQVLAASITALESLHDLIPDPAHVAAVRRLRDHSDARVRRAATAFLAWTEDDR